MGWYATMQALATGHGAYGTVQGCLRGEMNPTATLQVALEALARGMENGLPHDDQVNRRAAYWRRRYGLSPAPSNSGFQRTGRAARCE